MNQPLPPIFDDMGTEVSREVYWGQKELAAELGTTAPYVGTLLRSVGLLQRGEKKATATAEALESGAALNVTVNTVEGQNRYPRWRATLVLDVLRRALEGNPKPATKSEMTTYSPSFDDSPQVLERRVEELERRVESLERRLIQISRQT